MMEFEFNKRLPFLNKPENIARYEDGVVYILDRRIYPFEKKFVRCDTYEDVAVCVEKMVTQSYGPKYACGYGMVLAAHALKNEKSEAMKEGLRKAADRLIKTRPTNDAVKIVVDYMYDNSMRIVDAGSDLEQGMLDAMYQFVIQDNQRMDRLGKVAASLIEDGDTILTHCWPDTTIAYTIANVVEQGKRIQAYCGETRPYLQGARLTANAISELGVPVTVINDNMTAHTMSLGRINKFFAGCDRLTMGGYVFNKVGTLQIALCAKHFGIPVFIFSLGPDPKTKFVEDVINEERDPNESLYCLGHRTATRGVSGFYPAFDVTPPELISGIVTDTGVYSPFLMKHYWEEHQADGL